nr:anillin isoform X3 [Nothobranchius furzeri]
MEAREEDGGKANANLKRQREPLSDSEGNAVPAPEMKDGLKRRRLEAAGRENQSPKPSTSGRLAALQTKPDTPMIPSVRSRVQLLAQRRDVQRCFSDPGAEGSSVNTKDIKGHLLGEEEFNERLERFKAPVFQASPTPAEIPANPSPRARSRFVSGIQQKLQCSTTPSSKQAFSIRQERERELNQLSFQPISENAWLKRSNSDSSLTSQRRTPAGSSSPTLSVARSKRKVCWPPVQPSDVHDDDDDDTEMKDGSFIEMLKSATEGPANPTGEGTSSESAAVASAEKQNAHRDEEGQEKEHKAADVNKEQPGFLQPEALAVLQLSFSEEHSLSELQTAERDGFLQSTLLDESNTKETSQVFRGTEDKSEVFTFDEEETMNCSSYSEEGIEPSTDEELRVWRYPQGKVVEDEEERQLLTNKEGRELETFSEDKDKEDGFTRYNKPADPHADISSEADGSPEPQNHGNLTPEMRSMVDDSVMEKADVDEETLKSRESCGVGILIRNNDAFQQWKESQAGSVERETRALRDSRPEAQSGSADHDAGTHSDGNDGEAQRSTEIQLDSGEMEADSSGVRQDYVNKLAAGSQRIENPKRVTFILEPELINSSPVTESDTSMESRTETSLSDDGLSSHDETGTAEVIDKMFEEVLECAGNVEEKERVDEDAEDCDSGIGACSGDKDKMDTDVQKETSEEATEEGKDESNKLDSYGDELLTFPPSVILSPLSKSVEAAVTPMRLAAAQESSSSSLLLTPEETSTPPADFAPLYSVDAYRTQRQSKLPATQGVTPAAQRRATEVSEPQPLVNTKERIAALNEEAVKLQTVISQTLQALSCCTDEDHGRGSLEEAEAEKLLLVSCEKRSALLAEVTRLREEKSSESEGASTEEQQPCRGTVSITNIQLPLKVEFVCSSQNRAGRPSHYFFVLIRYGPCHIVATPLATAADARSGDAISFPTSVTLKDIRPGFEIEVEVYSLSHSSGTNSSADRPGAKSRVTPRKLLNTITKSGYSLTSSSQTSLSRRSSNFCLVGSHTISLASLGSNKFPLDKMKFEGKIRKLLGDEFQEKVPFLSPLEGNIYLKLDSEGHSDVRHQGFLTVFDLISGFGVWNRRFFVLQGCDLFYWNHPNDRETKEAEGSISLSKFPSQCVRPVNRDSCARPFTFELANEVRLQEDQNQEPLSRCWFSADTKQERLDWMEKLNQVLLDFHTWNRARPEPQQQNTTSSGNQ